MTSRAVAVVALCAACGGDDDAESGVVGTWIAEDSAVRCAYVANFAEDGDFDVSTICELEDGSLGVEGWLGTYDVVGDQLSLHNERSTCAGEATTDIYRWSRDGDQLTLAGDEGALVLEAAEPGNDGQAVLTYGCYVDGAFTPSPLADL